jgi:hypothetical protein
MRDRLGALDGHLSIVSAAGDGTLIAGSLPLPAHDADGRPAGSASPAGAVSKVRCPD